MKSMVAICFLLLVVSTTGQCQWFFPWWMLPYYADIEDEYAASLGGAPVGLYRRRRGGGDPFDEERSEVSGVSLGGAPVGLYGRERRPSFLRRWPLLG